MKPEDAALFAHRLAWLKREAEKERGEAHFKNGLAAGLEMAVCAIEEGRTFSFQSIDPPHQSDQRKKK